MKKLVTKFLKILDFFSQRVILEAKAACNMW